MLRKSTLHFVPLLFAMVFGNTAVFGVLPPIFITDLDTNDDNVITSVIDTNIYESYGESDLVPYPSHDGFGIVNDTGGWFDKRVDNNFGSGIFALDFFVTNNGPHTWSDYHFEFWEADFSNPLDVSSALVSTGNSRYPTSAGPLFTNSNFDGSSVLSWWAPEWQGPGQEQQFNMTLNFGELPSDFGIRQVATTVPLPAAFWLFGSGLLGMIGIARRKKK